MEPLFRLGCVDPPLPPILGFGDVLKSNQILWQGLVLTNPSLRNHSNTVIYIALTAPIQNALSINKIKSFKKSGISLLISFILFKIH